MLGLFTRKLLARNDINELVAYLAVFRTEIVKSCLDAARFRPIEVGDMDNFHATSPFFLEISKIASR